MSKRRKNNKQDKVKNEQASKAVQPYSISSEELKQIIVEAILKAEEEKQAKIAEQYKKEKEEWSRLFGEEDYSKLQWPERLKQGTRCVIKMITKIIIVKNSEIEQSFCTENFIKAILIAIFGLAELGAFLIIVGSILRVFTCLYSNTETSKWIIVAWLIVDCCIVLLVRFSRIMRIEIKKIENRDTLFALSGNIVAIISVIIAIITFFNG